MAGLEFLAANVSDSCEVLPTAHWFWEEGASVGPGLPSFLLASSKACSKPRRASGWGNSKMKASVPSGRVVHSSSLVGGKDSA